MAKATAKATGALSDAQKRLDEIRRLRACVRDRDDEVEAAKEQLKDKKANLDLAVRELLNEIDQTPRLPLGEGGEGRAGERIDPETGEVLSG